MRDISGFGIQVQVRASVTFPNGINVTEFSDDSDPFDLPSIQVGDSAMTLNGDLVGWRTANPIDITLNVIPGSDNDRDLAVLLEANRVARGKVPARDVITIVAVYPDERTLTLSEGIITNGPPGVSVASSGRLKTNAYMFRFQDKAES